MAGTSCAGCSRRCARDNPVIDASVRLGNVPGLPVLVYHGVREDYLQKSGLSPDKALDVVSDMPVTSPAAAAAAKLMLAEDYKPRFRVKLVAKDFGYAIDSATRVGADVPLTNATRSVFERLKRDGFEDENISAVARTFLKK